MTKEDAELIVKEVIKSLKAESEDTDITIKCHRQYYYHKYAHTQVITSKDGYQNVIIYCTRCGKLRDS